ncbi:MAG: hypothetical protein ABI085_02995 [Gemmatimonadaceae bacterium]
MLDDFRERGVKSPLPHPSYRHLDEQGRLRANPFDWKYTRQDLARLLARLTAEPNGLKIPA